MGRRPQPADGISRDDRRVAPIRPRGGLQLPPSPLPLPESRRADRPDRRLRPRRRPADLTPLRISRTICRRYAGRAQRAENRLGTVAFMELGRLRIDSVIDGTGRFAPTASFRGTTDE